MMKRKTISDTGNQQGIALPTVMVILLLTLLAGLYTARTIDKEQQVIADQYRSEQAFAAAQAGVDVGVHRHDHFEDYTGPGAAEDDIPSAGWSKGSFTVSFCDVWDDAGDEAKSAMMMKDFLTRTDGCNPLYRIDRNTADEPDGFENDQHIGILSVGKPDDSSGRRTISVISAGAPLFGGGPPPLPLTSRGPVDIGANITVINRYKNITIWTGQHLDMNSAAVSTYINDGTLDPETADRGLLIEDPGATPSCADIVNASTASCNKLGNNADILDGDTNLSSLSPEDMFERIYAASKSEIREMARSIGRFYTDDSFQGETGLIWLELSAGDQLPDIDVGTVDNPAYLIVDVVGSGAVKGNGGTAFGTVFIDGDVEFVGKPSITGSMIVTGTIEKSTGNPMVIFDPEGLAMNPEGVGGLRGIEPGTWKDWKWIPGS